MNFFYLLSLLTPPLVLCGIYKRSNVYRGIGRLTVCVHDCVCLVRTHPRKKNKKILSVYHEFMSNWYNKLIDVDQPNSDKDVDSTQHLTNQPNSAIDVDSTQPLTNSAIDVDSTQPLTNSDIDVCSTQPLINQPNSAIEDRPEQSDQSQDKKEQDTLAVS